MCGEPMQPDDEQFERRHLGTTASDPELGRKLEALRAKAKRDRADPKYNVLNAAVWHAYAGHLANRIVDLEAYFGPLSNLLDSLRDAARDANNAAELIGLLEKIEAFNQDAARYVRKLRKLSDEMDGELSWYSDEIFEEWGSRGPEQGDNDDSLA